jgi:uncharacterized membrane protein YhaH (DUF805 family)
LITVLLTMFVTASTIRRLHDLSLRGWWIILFPVLLIFLLLERGSDLDNRYGAPLNASDRGA